MTKTVINHTCGHSSIENLQGPYKGREERAAYLAGRICPDCYRAEQDAARAAAAAAAAEQAQAAGLPALSGSTKQIAWAEQIRAKAATELAALEAAFAAAEAAGKGDPAAIALGRAIMAETLSRTSAAAWIDGRDTTHSRDWLSRAVKARMPA